jgi:hypothetical protein
MEGFEPALGLREGAAAGGGGQFNRVFVSVKPGGWCMQVAEFGWVMGRSQDHMQKYIF